MSSFVFLDEKLVYIELLNKAIMKTKTISHLEVEASLNWLELLTHLVEGHKLPKAQSPISSMIFIASTPFLSLVHSRWPKAAGCRLPVAQEAQRMLKAAAVPPVVRALSCEAS